MAGDSSYASVSLLLHGEGSNGGSTFTDDSPTPKTPSLVGAPTTSTAQKKWGSASMSFGGSADALSYAHATSLNLASGDFTIEAWVYVTSLSTTRTLIQKDQSYGTTFTSYAIQFGTTGVVACSVGTGASAGYSQSVSTAAGLITTSTWQHVAFTRSGTTLRIFVDGALAQTATQTGSPNDGGKPVIVGRYPAGGGAADMWFAGYIDDLRITKGVARYTAAFTPDARAFPNGLGEIEGVVRDSAGALCSRTVRAYRRDTGVLAGSAVSDATTGAYLLATPTLDEVTVIALDNATSGTYYNDQVARVIPA